ncbi:MAG: hypothetical protein ACHQNT_01405 [Bacteroidia bacterium]
METIDIEILKSQWSLLLQKMAASLGEAPDLQGILFLIGVQELGKGNKNFSKDEKQDLMHIATCKLLSFYGYYELEKKDEEGWPHYKLKTKLPKMSLKEQDILLKQCVIEYFENNGIFEK